MTVESLLSVLADGKFHSGEQLGETLGVSRTAVWKQIKKVEGLGLVLESVKGKGYCIRGGLDLLSRSAIQSGLASEARDLLGDFLVLGTVDSTNTVATDGAQGDVIVAEQQTAGRGRRGRQWQSPFASNIYLSLVWEFAGGAAALEGLSLAVGVAVVDALAACSLGGVALKWPNDVLVDGRKLAGVLLEMSGDAAGPCKVIVGVGLNVNMPAAPAIDQPWVDVNTLAMGTVSRNQLVIALLNQLLPLLSHYERSGFASIRERWLALNAFQGEQVFVTLGDEVIVGHMAGVDGSGALLLDTVSGRRVFNGGEVSLRRVTSGA